MDVGEVLLDKQSLGVGEEVCEALWQRVAVTLPEGENDTLGDLVRVRVETGELEREGLEEEEEEIVRLGEGLVVLLVECVFEGLAEVVNVFARAVKVPGCEVAIIDRETLGVVLRVR